MSFLYPRLEKPEAILITEHLRHREPEPFDDPLSLTDIGKGITKATGGVPVSVEHLQKLRSDVFNSLSEVDPDLSGKAWDDEYDRRLGKVLWENLDMIPGESGSPEVWYFLALVVLPNTCIARYPLSDGVAKDKYTGDTRRLYLRSLWVRRQIYGSKLDEGNEVFSEDLHFQITDRVVTRTNPTLCRVIVDSLSHTADVSREYYRRLIREIRAVASYVPFAVLSEKEMQSLVHDIAVYVAQKLTIAPPKSKLQIIAGTGNNLSLGEPQRAAQVATEKTGPKDQTNTPSAVRGHFEAFKLNSEQAYSEAIAKREELRKPAEVRSEPTLDVNALEVENDEATADNRASETGKTVEPGHLELLSKSGLDGRDEDIDLVNSFTLRPWKKVYNRLKFRDMLEQDALEVFEEFLVRKKVNDSVAATLMMRCMATALERGIMKSDDIQRKIRS